MVEERNSNEQTTNSNENQLARQNRRRDGVPGMEEPKLNPELKFRSNPSLSGNLG